MREKIIIDTDPGIDDAFAIFYALRSAQFDVLGLTAVYGNASIEQTTHNALALVELLLTPSNVLTRLELRP